MRCAKARRQVGGRRLHRALSALVVAEVALSLVLLSGAGLLLRSFVKLQNIDLGYRAGGVLTAGVQLPGVQYDLARSGRLFPRRPCRASLRCPECAVRLAPHCMPPAGIVHRDEHLARRSTEARGRPAAIQSDPADHAGILHDAWRFHS